MKKKILAISLTVSLIAIAALGATLAYFTDTENVTNTFTVGNVKIELTEPNWLSSGATEGETIYPGEALKKDPTVKNVGANPCVVRLQVTMPEDFEDLISIETDYVTNKLGENWKKYTDGYYYYMKLLEVDDVTTSLFQQVRFSTTIENAENIEAANGIVVTAQAVQAQGIYPSYSTFAGGNITDTQLADKVVPFFAAAFS